MELGIIGEYIQYGIFAGLFLALFVYTLKNSEKRERQLTETLNKFAEQVGDTLAVVSMEVQEIKADVEEIKEKIE